MTIARIVRFLLMICVGATANAQVTGTPGAQTSQQATLVLKVGAEGSVSVDGKVSANGEAGQILTLSLQPGQHLVSLKTPDGKTIERLVTLDAGHSAVVVLGAPQSNQVKAKGQLPAQTDSSPSKQVKPKAKAVPATSGSHGPTQPTAQPQLDNREEARLAAFNILGLCKAGIDEARRFNTETEPWAITSMNISLSTAQKMRSTGHPLISNSNCLGEYEEALNQANQRLRENMAVAPDAHFIEFLLIPRAVALFATGEQIEGIAEMSLIPALRRFIDSVESGASAADQDNRSRLSLLPDEQLAAMKALIDDWSGCIKSLPPVSDADLEKEPDSKDFFQRFAGRWQRPQHQKSNPSRPGR